MRRTSGDRGGERRDSRAQGAAAELAGADAILVGSALMRADDPAAKLRELLSRPLVKVCGLTREEDVDAAVEAGADLLGFILAEESPRRAPRVCRFPTTASALPCSSATWRRRAPISFSSTAARRDGRGRDAVLLRGDERSRRSSTSPGKSRTRSISSARRAVKGA